MQTAIQRKWLALSASERKLARRACDWQHTKSQLTFADIDETYDWLTEHGLELEREQMISLVVEAGHIASGHIMAIHRSIWFNLK